MKENLAEIIPFVINAFLSGIHTAIPGKIEKYDRDNFRADVTPSLKHLTRKNQEIEIQTITDVPVIMFGGSSGLLDVELVKGDNVLLIICEAGIGGWKSSSGTKQIVPDDLSYHELNNAIAIPCLIPDGQISSFTNVPRVKIDKNGDIFLLNDNGSVVLKNNGQAIVNDHFTVDP